MMPGGDGVAGDDAGEQDPLERLAASARGWHQIQLAVLGFIGFCGVFWRIGDGPLSGGWQWLAVALVAVGFVLAVVAVFLVGRAAYPFHAPSQEAESDRAATTARQQGRLHLGVRATYIAVVLVVAATLFGWLPTATEEGAVELGDAGGDTWCGQLVEAPAGEARVATTEGHVAVPLDRLVVLRPADTC